MQQTTATTEKPSLLRRLRKHGNGILASPGSGWRRKSRSLTSSGLFWPLLAILMVLIALGVTSFLMLSMPDNRYALYLGQLTLLVIGAVIIGLILFRINHHLMTPLAHLRHWALRMRGGNLAAKIPVPSSGEFAELAGDINSLGEELKNLSRELDNEVKKQTKRIEQKSRSLEILYDVAASINTSRDLNDLLERFLRTLVEVVGAKAGVVRLLTEDEKMRLVASIGLDEEIIEQERLIDVNRCLCGKAVQAGELMSQDNVQSCNRYAGRDFFEQVETEMIAIPLQYRDNTLGVYNLFVDKPGIVNREDIQNLLTSIGRHLGMAIEKAKLDEESKRLSILQERNMLSAELHDSLAQTLASLRFQVRMLDDTLHHGDKATAKREIVQIRNALDEAYTELRELLAHCRAPFDERGLLAAIEDVVDRFRKEGNILIFFQNQWPAFKLPSIKEMQVLRIIQESLTNIRKHSQAHAVRVLLKQEADGELMALIEDDGIGIRDANLDGKPGEHVGLSIMQERAQRLGGELIIESEPGEGTRIMLRFRVDEQQPSLLDIL